MIGGIEILNASVDRNPVNDIQRFVASAGHRANTANTNLQAGARFVAVRDDFDAGHFALQGLHRIGRRNVLELFRSDGRNGTRDVTTFLLFRTQPPQPQRAD